MKTTPQDQFTGNEEHENWVTDPQDQYKKPGKVVRSGTEEIGVTGTPEYTSKPVDSCPCHCHAGGNYKDCHSHKVISCKHCQQKASKPVGEWKKDIVNEEKGILSAVLLGKDVDPDYYKRPASEIDPYLRDKSLACYEPDRLIPYIQSLLSAQKQDFLEKLELIKDDLDRAIVRYGDRQLVRDATERIEKMQKEL